MGVTVYVAGGDRDRTVSLNGDSGDAGDPAHEGLDPARAGVGDSASHTLGLRNRPQKEQVPPRPVRGLVSTTQTEPSRLPLTPQPKTNVLPQLAPSTKSTEVCAQDVLPNRGPATLGPAITTKSLPYPESSRKREDAVELCQPHWLLWHWTTHRVRSSLWPCRASLPRPAGTHGYSHSPWVTNRYPGVW